MAVRRNFLLGGGERLTEPVVVRGGAAINVPPYTVAERKAWLGPRLDLAASTFDRLPAVACPGGRVVGALTINPEYIAKSYYPEDLLQSVGLRAVGSRPKQVTPQKRSRNRDPEEAMTTELFVVGQREAFHMWAAELPGWVESSRAAEDLVTIEDVAAPEPRPKIKGVLPAGGAEAFDVVLHVDAGQEGDDLVQPFRTYLDYLRIKARIGRRFHAGGLCFLELRAPAENAEAIATYTMVRALRQMPGLRMLRPTIAAVRLPTRSIELPPAKPVDTTTVAAIFDGGLPATHPLTTWAHSIDAPGVGPALPQYLEHGVGVTSAFLFGHIDPSRPLPQPYCRVDHYRVLDAAPGQNPFELYDVLERIQAVLASRTYSLINISLGPVGIVEDDNVSAWTSVLDTYLAEGRSLATFAVGNAADPQGEPGRIQAPADCVNALAVGACDRPDAGWRRADYSLVGPGRSPGIVKPDLVAFGGSMPRPFLVTGPGSKLTLHPTGGTSYAAPSVLRLGAGIRAHFGKGLGLLAIRALLIHSCEASDHPTAEVGRGRLGSDLEPLVLCADDEVKVVYQGEISPSKYVRVTIAMPAEPLTGMVMVSATLCSVTTVDPHHPGNYTRAGLVPTFRPRSDARSRPDQVHADTCSFFGIARSGMTEEQLRRDASKWENVQHAARRFRGASLHNPAFDLHYNARQEGKALRSTELLPYALVVTIKAPRMPDLYDRIRRRYATQLPPLMPVIEVPIRT